MDKKALLLGAFFGCMAIVLGAFGAHALKAVLTENQLTSYETGVRYQMYHALFLIFISQTQWISAKAKNTITWFTIIGITLFSFSIYLLSLQDVLGIKWSFLGPITPVGGVFLILSWILLFFNGLKQKTNI